MANAFQNLLHELHESVVEDRLMQFDVPEMPLALSCFPASLTFLIERANAKTEVVGT